ncbi:uncharacterized protein PRCAT00004445001 [Priceomyces carsonii]|uniref:uncharacterized protein n=1 Tax=Priceomyces carsonii TaxID=28549 RepID=UPI002ED7D7A6|nr:unnamed protein product [Priceomyces carsonii]
MAARNPNPGALKQEQVTPNEALKLYRNTLNFNVISRYDPSIKQLLYHTTYCVIYKFNDELQEWTKTDYLGMLALYLRDFKVPSTGRLTSYQDLQNLFCYGLILMNRNNPECFSLGLLPNKFIKHFFPNGVNGLNVLEMDVELNDNLIIVKNLLGEIFGLWVFNEDDRRKLFKSLEYCLNNEASVITK